jgi:drug/metabolite transporter (DMT)-like permease
MGLGLGVFLLVLGLILVSGVIQYDIDLVEDTTLGWILLFAGVLTIVLGLVMNRQRTRTKHVEERRTGDH